ncbi:hypothetical protein [Halorubellus sp. PRR65]|uniref:hypothetical protein n=1 Tax=Halorubellus sp. PRR65 TaxID=3098148 RepID=UPI002B25EFE4|nr:hypothetical protein [Halorubellus sp. PRR65]
MVTEPEFLLETSDVTEVLNDVGELVRDDFSEDEVQMVFLNEGYFQLLGYEDVGTNLRSELSVESGIVDYVTSGHGDTIRDTNTIVYEFKNPTVSLDRHFDQLADYMDGTRGVGAAYGVLTNGHRFQLYRGQPTEPKQLADFRLDSATELEGSLILSALGYWSIQEQNIKPVAERAAAEVVEEIPEELHIEFSEAGVDLFAEHLARYLKAEFRDGRTS